MNQMVLKTTRVTVNITLDRTLFPLTFIELTNSLEKLGFEISKTFPFPRPVGRFIGSGHIARKGNIVCNIDAGRQSFSMIGKSFEATLEEFDSFLHTLKTEHSVDLDEYAKFYQIVSRYEYKTNRKAFQVVSDFFTSPKIDELAKIMEIPIKTFSIQVGSADAVPTEVNWFDMHFIPDVSRNDGYSIALIYRNENRKVYRNFIRLLEERVMKSIQLIEG